MKILAIEFSSTQRSVAVVIDGRVAGQASHVGDRSVPAFDIITRALAEAKLERENIECLAIGLGPGSYTGIRAAISLAQGWQLARPIKLLGISSAECLAWEAQNQGCTGAVNIAIDAQRGEFYLATYEISANACKETEPLRLVSRLAVEARASARQLVVGPDAAQLFAGGRMIFPTAATLGRLAEKRADYVLGEKLEPIYLRETAYVKATPSRSGLKA
jgi:tRNA threonylcarbamoyl adenosine modification protein YeaZ